MKFRACALAALGLASSTAAFAAVVTITSNNAQVGVYDPSAGYAGDSFSGTGIPSSQLLSASAGSYYSKNQIDYSVSGGQTTLSNVLDQMRGGAIGGYAQGYEAFMWFTVDADTTYTLSGAYNVRDSSTAGVVFLYSYLYDYTTNVYLAESYQHSDSTVNESFTLGGLGGDYYNYSSGSLSGSLLAGHLYSWHWNAAMQAYPDSDGGASATGSVVLKIGDLPEPGSLALVLLAGGIGAVASSRRRRTGA